MIDPLTLGVVRGGLEQATEEMDLTLKRAAFSPVISEGNDLANGCYEPDTGEVIELRSRESLKTLWEKMRKNETLQVRLYGRENSWIKDNKMYYAEGELFLTARKTFRINILKAKALSLDEILVVKKRCKSLKPRRNCQPVFDAFSAPETN